MAQIKYAFFPIHITKLKQEFADACIIIRTSNTCYLLQIQSHIFGKNNYQEFGTLMEMNLAINRYKVFKESRSDTNFKGLQVTEQVNL